MRVLCAVVHGRAMDRTSGSVAQCSPVQCIEPSVAQCSPIPGNKVILYFSVQLVEQLGGGCVRPI